MGTVKVTNIEPIADNGTVTLGGSGDTITLGSGATVTGNGLVGITMSDSWRLTANTNLGTNGVISTNWEQVDESRSAEIGTALTESSGVFTLPQTGIYLIIYFFCINIEGDATSDVRLEFTDDNSTFDPAATAFAGNNVGSLVNLTGSANFMFGITDTANQKFRFSTSGFGASEQVRGDTNLTESGFSIVRLGDNV